MDVTLLAARDWREKVRRAVAQGLQEPYVAEGLRKDGSTFWGRVVGTNVAFRGERCRVTSVEDITEQYLAEKALKESEQKFRSLAERSPNMIFINSGGRVVYANPLCEEKTGYTVEEITSDDFDFRRLVAPESMETVQKAWERHRAGQDVEPYEYLFITKDGRKIPVVNSTRLIEYGGVPAILGVVTDISRVKEAEKKLRISEQRYRMLVETSPDAILHTDRETRILMANRRAAALAGIDRPERLHGALAAEILKFPASGTCIEDLKGDNVPSVLGGIECEFLRADGTTVPVEISASVLREDGEPSGFIFVVRDITERKQLEQERRNMERKLLHAQKLESMGVLAGGIAHDFNNLLMGILGNASLALADLEPHHPALDAVRRVEQSAVRAAELTSQMLAYSGKGKFVVRKVNLSELVREMTELLRVSVAKSAALRLELDDSLPPVEADASQLRQVVMNLITNASEAIGDESGVITVFTGTQEVGGDYLDGTLIGDGLEAGKYVVLEVTDTGCGMDEQTRSRMFDPFFTTKFTGRGLGLAAVLGIVRGHGGTIKVYSESGRGTTVKVLLPAASGEAEGEGLKSKSIERIDLSGRTVLVVDDEEMVRTVAREILERAGARVILASSGRQCLELYSQQKGGIDLVLLDTTMPGLSGEETFRKLRELDPDVRVVLSSGYNAQEVTSRFAGKPLSGFLQKPYRARDLLDVAASVLGGRNER
ncbi:MAG: PAS domain S-box protein [Deltaproteobacteria bacterium]|nr:MAG: PAS domain S-box protein [Deltaproteobacteria bacterium]